MTTSVSTVDGPDTETDPSGQTQDPGLKAKGSVTACQSKTGFTTVKVKPAGKGLRFQGSARGPGSITAEVFLVAKGKKAAKPKRVAAFDFKGSHTWNGKVKGKPAAAGFYYVRMTTRGTGPRPDVRSYGFQRSGRFKTRKPFQRADSCGAISLFRLDSPAFGGKRKLGISFTTTRDSKATVQILRGKRSIRRFSMKTKANRLAKVFLSPKGLRKGEYTIALKVGKRTERLYARKL